VAQLQWARNILYSRKKKLWLTGHTLCIMLWIHRENIIIIYTKWVLYIIQVTGPAVRPSKCAYYSVWTARCRSHRWNILFMHATRTTVVDVFLVADDDRDDLWRYVKCGDEWEEHADSESEGEGRKRVLRAKRSVKI